MEENGTRPEEVWGPIAMANWRETPCVRGRVATEEDVLAAKAVFYLNLSEGQESNPIELDLPLCAILHEDGQGDLPVIVVQAEEGYNGTYQRIAGYRPLTGGNGICMLFQLELLAEPDSRFMNRGELFRQAE